MRRLRDADVDDKRVLVRADYNVPLENGRVADDFRIRAGLSTIESLIERRARIAICSHLGRPGGQRDESLSLAPVAERLGELLGRDVGMADDCVGAAAEEAVGALEPGEVVLLENTRFHPGEKENDPDFARQLASLAEIYVDDAFATAHRAHASTEGVARLIPSYAGELLEREIDNLGNIRDDPYEPYVAAIGGAKIGDKIDVMDRLVQQVETLLVGGGIANTFLKARGTEVGDSLVDEDSLEEANRLLEEWGDTLELPVDAVIAEELEDDAATRTVDIEEVSPNWKILDIGPATLDHYTDYLKEARQVVWSGPLGAFESAPFAEGTLGFAKAMAELQATTVTGGGETVLAVHRAGVADKLSHVSTGGGAFLQFMEGRALPAVEALE